MAVSEAAVQESFRKLRPVCVTLTKEHTSKNVLQLQAYCEELDAMVLQGLQEYVLFPLRLLLKQSKTRPEDVYIKALDCLSLVVGRTQIQSLQIFHDVFNMLCLIITVQKDFREVSPVSEEVKLSVVRALSCLMKSTSVNIIDEIYKPSFLPALGHAITVLLNLAEKEENRELRVSAINCVMDIALVNRKICSRQMSLSSRLFASFLPGISMSLCRVIIGDVKVGHHTIVIAIETWHKIVTLVLGDKNILEVKSIPQLVEEDTKYVSLVVDMTDEWVRSTSERLHVLTQKIKEMAENGNWRVRLAMVEWASGLLTNCTRSLEPSTPDFIEVLVALVNDDYKNVAQKSKINLDTYAKSSFADTKTLAELLEENLHTIATQLPRLIRTADEDKKLSKIRLFNGYMQLLGLKVKYMLCSAGHLQRVSLSLLQVLELDCSSISLIQEKHYGKLHSCLEFGQVYSKPQKHFKNFNDDNIYLSLVETCKNLGRYGDCDVLYDHFLEFFYQNKIYRKQAIIIINHMTEGLLEKDCREKTDGNLARDNQLNMFLIRSVLDVYLNPEYFNLQTNCAINDNGDLMKNPVLDLRIVSSHGTTSKSIMEMNSNVLQTCLLLEGIGVFIKVLGKSYEHLMTKVLYPVLEKIGHENAAISQMAYITINNIAMTYGYSCIEDLIKANVDYLVNAVSLRMRHLDQYPNTPTVLSVMLQYSDQNILPMIEDTINEVLDALDSYYEDLGLLFVRVLFTMTSAITKWHTGHKQAVSEDLNPLPKTNSIEPHCSTSEMVKQYVSDYLQQKKIAEGEDIGYDMQEQNSNPKLCDHNYGEDGDMPMEDTVQEEKIPYHIKKIKPIMGRCVHLLSVKDVKVRILTLDTVSEGLLALQSHENELLPLVHQLWAPFVQRLRDTEMVVIIKACSVLNTFAVVSKTFIRQRLLKDVFPVMIDFLKKQSLISLKAGPVYHHNMACKLQVHILQGVGQLCHLVGVEENQLSSIIAACMPYLSTSQPKILQEACLKTFKQFCMVEPDTVWLILHRVYCPVSITPPEPSLLQIKFKDDSTDEDNKYMDNIVEVLKYT